MAFKMNGSAMYGKGNQANYGAAPKNYDTSKGSHEHPHEETGALKEHKEGHGKTLTQVSDSTTAAHDKFMEDRMKVLQKQASKSSDSLSNVKNKVLTDRLDKKVKTMPIGKVNKEIEELNNKNNPPKNMDN